MTQTRSKIFDDVARFATGAVGAAQGLRQEIQTMVRSQVERFTADMDLVQREEFEAVKEMALLAREENEKLEARIAALEAQLAGAADASPAVPVDTADPSDPAAQ